MGDHSEDEQVKADEEDLLVTAAEEDGSYGTTSTITGRHARG